MKRRTTMSKHTTQVDPVENVIDILQRQFPRRDPDEIEALSLIHI